MEPILAPVHEEPRNTCKDPLGEAEQHRWWSRNDRIRLPEACRGRCNWYRGSLTVKRAL